MREIEVLNRYLGTVDTFTSTPQAQAMALLNPKEEDFSRCQKPHGSAELTLALTNY